MTTPQALKTILTESADLCVKCGLCLPHCPTYQVANEEGESPRGRIAMLGALATEQISASPDLHRHVQQCLGCRACERVCPAKVPYGEMLDAGREVLASKGRKPALSARLLARTLSSASSAAIVGLLLRCLQRLGVIGFIARLKLPGTLTIARLCRLLPANASRFAFEQDLRAMQNSHDVQIHTGCVASIIDGDTLRDAVAVLSFAGFSVKVPPNQGCCGALVQHAGRGDSAISLAKQNLDAFDPESPVVSLASGCAATLLEYGRISHANAQSFSKNLFEISRFLDDRWPADRVSLHTVGARVFLHTPCTLRNVLRHPETTYSLLARIPGCEIQLADERIGCCGAGGSNVIQYPAIADELGTRLVSAANHVGADYLVTSNIGCAMHLGGLIRKEQLDIQVVHPVSLLAKAIR